MAPAVQRRSLLSPEFLLYYGVIAQCLWQMVTRAYPALARTCAHDIFCVMSLRSRHIDATLEGGPAWAATWSVRDAVFGAAARTSLVDSGVAVQDAMVFLTREIDDPRWSRERAEFESRKGYGLSDAVQWRARGAVDLSDHQWRGFRDALPALVVLAAVQLLLSAIWLQRCGSASGWRARWLPRLGFGVVFV